MRSYSLEVQRLEFPFEASTEGRLDWGHDPESIAKERWVSRRGGD